MRAITIAACALAVSTAWADDHNEGDGTAFFPVETYTCSYREGKGPADIEKATAFWNKWADKHGFDKYFAATVTPVYHGADTFDIGWIGAWADGATMGANSDAWMNEGGEAAARFGEAVDCETHSNFATMQMKAPPETDPDTFYLAFTDCEVADGVDWDAMFGGMAEWAAYSEGRGYKNGSWVMFPAYGGGKEEFDFKVVESWDTMADLGAGFDMYGTGGDWAKHAELVGDGVMCDSARVYRASVVRRPARED